MDDLISRQAAIEALRAEHETLEAYMEECLKDFHFASRAAARDARNRIEEDIYILENLPSAQPEQRWIPVTEARPPRQTKVIVTDWCSVTMAYINDDGKGTWMDTHGNKLKDVTAWMPLPEPPEKGE